MAPTKLPRLGASIVAKAVGKKGNEQPEVMLVVPKRPSERNVHAVQSDDIEVSQVFTCLDCATFVALEFLIHELLFVV